MTRPSIQGLLIDLDGTVWVDDRAIPGTREAIAALRAAGLPFRFATNITRRPRALIVEQLEAMGIRAAEDEVITASSAAAAWLARRGARRVSLLLDPVAFTEFAAFEHDDERPEFVVMGDLGPAWSFEILDRAFRALMNGAELVAIQRNRYWLKEGALTLDAGAFVAALEYASGKSARLIGKPSPGFYESAVADLDLPAGRIAMIGDDLDADVAGAREAGLRAVALRTGKYRPEDEERAVTLADGVLDSLAALPDWLGSI
jgi:HAD superfamily hydrolase (TIGR01458 family)